MGDYVIQALVAPGEPLTLGETSPLVFKYDLRNNVCEDEVQWVAARLYQGQTTNFGSAGGGFAQVCGLQAENPATRGRP